MSKTHVENLVIKDGKVEGESQTDRVSGGEFSGGDSGRRLIRLVSGFRRGLASVTCGKLGEVTVVVALPRNDIIISQTFPQCDNKRTITNILW